MGRHALVGGWGRHTAGFTFVEILAALMFLAVVIPAIVTALTLSNRAGELTERGAAGELVENKLNEMLTADAWQAAGSTAGGDCGPEWPGYRWEMTQTPWTGGGSVGGSSGLSGSPAPSGTSAVPTGNAANGAGSVAVTELKVAVFFKVQGAERSVALTTLVNALTSSTGTTATTPTGVSTP